MKQGSGDDGGVIMSVENAVLGALVPVLFIAALRGDMSGEVIGGVRGGLAMPLGNGTVYEMVSGSFTTPATGSDLEQSISYAKLAYARKRK
jgi:hypothetical protein